mgnify:CR=1 FL=1
MHYNLWNLTSKEEGGVTSIKNYMRSGELEHISLYKTSFA